MLKLIRTSKYLSRQINPGANKYQIGSKVTNLFSNHNCVRRNFADKRDTHNTDEKGTTSSILRDRFDVFREENAPIILDVEEERDRAKAGMVESALPEVDAFEGLNLERGLNGVFEIEDLVDLLKRDNARDIFVCHVPKKLHYVDFICIVTARSTRHLKAIAEFVRKLYKFKASSKDILPKIEGIGSTEWIAMDLGNIVLHIFEEETRSRYDLETLWTVGSEFDSESNKPIDPLIDMYEKNTSYLADLVPAEQHTEKKEKL